MTEVSVITTISNPNDSRNLNKYKFSPTVNIRKQDKRIKCIIKNNI